MRTLLADIRFALRTFARTPLFTLAVLASLAIGIGANTALFSVTSALLLRPLPYADPDRLVILWNRSPGLNIAEDWFSTAQYFDIKNGHSGFEQVAIAIGGNDTLTGDTGEPERIGVIRISSNLLPMLGVQPAQGRLFVREEDSPGRAPVALLAHGTWVRRYGSDPAMLGKKVILNGEPREVVGILPGSFRLPREVLPTLGGAEQAEIMVPLPLGPDAANARNREDYNIMGKLKPGVTRDAAQAEMSGITARLRQEFPAFYPPNGGLTFDIVPLQEQVVGKVRLAVLVLMGSVGIVLLIACANVANLLLSRAVVRQREIAVRQALGADARRVVRQLLTESITLALAGGGLGIFFSFALLELLRALGPASVPRLADIGIDAGVLLFTFALACVSGVVFGLAPAVRLLQIDVVTSLKDATRGSSGAGSPWGRGASLRGLLVVGQLAMSVVLLIGAGLLIRSFVHLQSVPPGFNPQNALTLQLTMTGKKYQNREAVQETYRRLWQELAQIPGVTAAGGVSALPLSEMAAWAPIQIEGRVPLPGENFINSDVRTAAGDYFAAMQIPLLRGRLFNEHDDAKSPRVAIVDDFMAEQMWPGQDPLGKRFRFGGIDSSEVWITVVGVVGRVKHESLDLNDRIAFYLAHTQSPRREMNIVLRGEKSAADLTAGVKQVLRNLDPDLPMFAVRTMEQRVAGSLARRRFSMVLLGVFAGVALLLASLGIYSMMAYLVSQGTRDIGIRMALGASGGGIAAEFLRRGLTLAATGAALGIIGAFLLTRTIQSLLFGVKATDILTFSLVPLLLLATALVATYLPARRAARVDPMVALRYE